MDFFCRILNQQAEIKDFIETENNKPIWKSKSILKRHKILLEFAIKNWGFDNIDTEYLEEKNK
jgi:hypothetical protein